ncbi:DUF637 domain-containing protein, partial [Pseudomonas sp. ICMP 10191]|uniref:DUF637 domain-containing protein n=1 Tax=Pseudomonas sp. ICMP 10191 TaxID=1198294 RepID=UPI000B02A4EA
KDVTSSSAIKGYAMAGVMAGFVPTINPKNLGLDLASVQTVATKVITESVIKTAIMGGYGNRYGWRHCRRQDR